MENINGNTKKITGVTEKQIRNVVLMTDEGKKLEKVILRIFYDPIKDEGGCDTLKTVKFMVQNK